MTGWVEKKEKEKGGDGTRIFEATIGSNSANYVLVCECKITVHYPEVPSEWTVKKRSVGGGGEGGGKKRKKGEDENENKEENGDIMCVELTNEVNEEKFEVVDDVEREAKGKEDAMDDDEEEEEEEDDVKQWAILHQLRRILTNF